MAWAPIVLAVAGTAVSTYAAIREGQQAKAAANYNAAVAGNEAKQSLDQATLQAQQDQRQAALDAGAIQANLGASGSSGGGSGEDVSMDVQNQHNLQTNTDLYLGKLTANKFLTDQATYGYQANNEIPNSILKAGSALLQGGTNAAMDYHRLTTPPGNPAPVVTG